MILQFIDEGSGIPVKDLPYVFDKFFRGSNNTPEQAGTGLGLAIVKSVAEAHGGRVRDQVGGRRRHNLNRGSAYSGITDSLRRVESGKKQAENLLKIFSLFFGLNQASAGGGEEDPAEAFAKGGDSDEQCWRCPVVGVSGIIVTQCTGLKYRRSSLLGLIMFSYKLCKKSQSNVTAPA